MKKLIFILFITLANVLEGQTVIVKNDTVYVEARSIGVLKHNNESYVSGSGFSITEKRTTLYTFTPQTPELINLIKNRLSNTYLNFDVRQYNGNVMRVDDNMYRAGRALRSSGNYQILVLIGVPLFFFNPVIGGAVVLSGTIGSISQKIKAGRIMMGR